MTAHRRAARKGGQLRRDAIAGTVLGGQSVPSALATGLIAGVNPAYSLYGCLFGMAGAAAVTSSQFMSVQTTGAMAAIVADVDVVHNADDPSRALFTLTMLVGLVMIGAGLLKLGNILRFVSHAVLVGFIAGVGINIAIGQLDSFTGYEAHGDGRLARVLDLLVHPWRIDLTTFAIGLFTVFLILVFQRTRRWGPAGLIGSIVVSSVVVALFDLNVTVLRDLVEVPAGLPLPKAPDLGAVPELIVPAFSLAFVGLVQGAGISANYPNPDGSQPDVSRDFVGQGVGNVVAGAFNGLAVGGSMSATSVGTSAGSASRWTQFVAAVVMAVIVLLVGPVVNDAAMPALAGLLIVVGIRAVDRDDLVAVWKTGMVQRTAMGITLVLTVIIPLQFAVLIGVGASVLLYVVQQSQDFVIRQVVADESGYVERAPDPTLASRSVVVLQPYGSLFFATATALDDFLPDLLPDTHRSVVILRFRGRNDLGSTLADTLSRYAKRLHAADCRLVVIVDSDRALNQLKVTGFHDLIGEHNVYRSEDRVGSATNRAIADAEAWIDEAPAPSEGGGPDGA
ncbi:MAG: SulP family inorganic anion transporter [Actinobacteria bacterium]|nr:SulP family inorganic anion transporter [Actinomycetota bacterium]